jgi:hypothetical protein
MLKEGHHDEYHVVTILVIVNYVVDDFSSFSRETADLKSDIQCKLSKTKCFLLNDSVLFYCFSLYYNVVKICMSLND